LAECEDDCTSSVCPSASPFTTAAVPICPPAPGRFSTITGCFQCSLMRCAMMRPAMSAPDPGVSGIITRTVLVGYSCAPALKASAAAAIAK
jgi:hypothetical protein